MGGLSVRSGDSLCALLGKPKTGVKGVAPAYSQQTCTSRLLSHTLSRCFY